MKSSTAVVFLLALVNMLQAKGQEDEEEQPSLKGYNSWKKPCLKKKVLVGGSLRDFL